MDALVAIKKRRSVREYTGDAIPRGDLVKIVDAGRFHYTYYQPSYSGSL